MTTTPTWKEIEGFEGLYEVSDIGQVRSIRSNKILKPSVKKGGYCGVSFSVDGYISYHNIHRLVAKAFIPNPDDLPCVNHIDSNPSNNRVENLEWVTHRGNTLHKFEDGVSYHSPTGKYRARIYIDGSYYHLGAYDTKEAASEVYHSVSTEYISNGTIPTKMNKTSVYKGVSLDKRAGKWESYVHIEGRKKSLGYFDTEREAFEVRNTYLENITTF